LLAPVTIATLPCNPESDIAAISSELGWGS
jgi:hypothetical protein